MKSISASLVLLSGALMLMAASLSQGDLRDVTSMLGFIVVLVGLIVWVVTVFKKD